MGNQHSEGRNKEIMKAYLIFEVLPLENKMSKDEFLSHYLSLSEEKSSSFWRASVIFQDALKCKDCNRNIAMTLLCSAVEAMNPKESSISFVPWLIKNRLNDLEMKNRKELREAINSAFNDFVKIPNREGARYNFIQFLLKNCPEPLKVVPNVLNRDVSFKEILEYIYDKFRSPYLHEALPSFDKLEKKDFVTVIQHRLLISREKKLIALELEEFFEWFSHVVKESLCRDFIS